MILHTILPTEFSALVVAVLGVMRSDCRDGRFDLGNGIICNSTGRKDLETE